MRRLSDSFQARTGIDPCTILGSNMFSFKGLGMQSESDWRKLLRRMRSHRPFHGFTLTSTIKNRPVQVTRLSGKPVFDADGHFKGYRGSGIDVTESHQLSRKLNFQASHDALTGLVNRREFESRLQQALENTRQGGKPCALCYLDLDQFKLVNDTCGHLAGDKLLAELGELLSGMVREQDTLARIGGDEFTILLMGCPLEQALQVTRELLRILRGFRFWWGERHFQTGASFGLIPIDKGSATVSEVLQLADTACYIAKEQGGNRIHVYQENDRKLAKRQSEMQWVTRINQALAENRFTLLYLPIEPLQNDSAHEWQFEILVRMIEGDSTISPVAFMSAAERFHLAQEIDRWVIRHTCEWLWQNPRAREAIDCCFVNLSAQSLAEEGFYSHVLEIMDEYRTPGTKLCFEITETAAMSNITKAVDIIHALKSRGCRFALDDFGSGLSSFAYLKRLPVDVLKIDGTFVRDMVEDSIDLELVKSINDIGHVMGMRTIAEFVDREETRKLLQKIGVDYCQGFAISGPKPLTDLRDSPPDSKNFGNTL